MRDEEDAVIETDKKTEIVAILYEVSVEKARETGDNNAKGIPVNFSSQNVITYKEKKVRSFLKNNQHTSR